MARDKKSFKRNLKTYNAVMSNFWLLITFVLFGVGVGYLLSRLASGIYVNIVWLLTAIFFALLGIFNFFFRLIKDLQKLNKEEEKEVSQLNLKKIEEEKDEEDV